MSSTRHAAAGSGFRQERFASTQEDEGRLLANLVARRCQAIEDRKEVEAIMFAQWCSHQPGGLERLARAIIENTLDRDLKYKKFIRSFEDETGWGGSGPCVTRTEENLQAYCLNPKSSPKLEIGASDSFPEALALEMKVHAAAAETGLAQTEIARQVFDGLDFALETSSMVLIEGNARIGKSFAARNWCARRPGVVRYVQVPSSNEEKAFHRKIAEAVGVSCSASKKGAEIRERVEAAVQGVNLMLVLDEAHYLWPQVNTRVARPKRINWIMTELANYGVPVALISTPQFSVDQQRVEKNTGWASEQFIGRISYRQLPGVLSLQDLEAVARFHLPEGSDKTIAYLANYAVVSKSYVAGIEKVVTRARFEARKAGDPAIKFSHIDHVITNYAQPSDNALAQRFGQSKQRGQVVTSPAAASLEPPPRRSNLPADANRLNRSGNMVASG